jgi:hypothetical protein
MREFAEIFSLGVNFFGSRGAQIGKEDFINDVSEINLDFSQYEICKYALISMMGLKPINDE